MKPEDIQRLREVSGEINSDDPLVSFLYHLMRDHLPTGVVEGLVLDTQIFNGTTHYTNGFLAQYAMDLAKRLK